MRIFFGIFGGLGFELFMLQTKLGDAWLHLHTTLKCHILNVLFPWVLRLGGVGTIYVTRSSLDGAIEATCSVDLKFLFPEISNVLSL